MKISKSCGLLSKSQKDIPIWNKLSFLYLNNNTPLLLFISFITSSEERQAFAVQKQDHSPRYVQ